MDNSFVPLIDVAIYFCILKSSFILYRAKSAREMRNFLFLIFRCVFASRSFSFERTVSLCSRRNDRTGTRGVTSFCSFFFKLHRLDAKRESFERSLGIAIVCPWRTRISFQPPCVPSTCVKMRANREGAPRRRIPWVLPRIFHLVVSLFPFSYPGEKDELAPWAEVRGGTWERQERER